MNGTDRPVVVVSRFLPDPQGPASARLLHGFVTGARETGRDVTVWSWWPGPPPADLPSYVRWEPLGGEPQWRTKARALVRPRSDVAALRWRVPGDALAIAEEPLSFAVVRSHPASVLTVHYSPDLDRRALQGGGAAHVQDVRAQRAAVRRARVVTAYSTRVAASLGQRAVTVPAAMAMPAVPIAPVDDPVVACVADWTWPPNRIARFRLLESWPLVRRQLPHARLVLAGKGEAGRGDAYDAHGVAVLGPVGDSHEVLARAAALVFPVPPTSGPKVKVLEAAALGLPVLTTGAGIEGLALSGDEVALVDDSADPTTLSAGIVALLSDPGRRASLATAARARVAAAHAPVVAARERLARLAESAALG